MFHFSRPRGHQKCPCHCKKWPLPEKVLFTPIASPLRGHANCFDFCTQSMISYSKQATWSSVTTLADLRDKINRSLLETLNGTKYHHFATLQIQTAVWEPDSCKNNVALIFVCERADPVPESSRSVWSSAWISEGMRLRIRQAWGRNVSSDSSHVLLRLWHVRAHDELWMGWHLPHSSHYHSKALVIMTSLSALLPGLVLWRIAHEKYEACTK